MNSQFESSYLSEELEEDALLNASNNDYLPDVEGQEVLSQANPPMFLGSFYGTHQRSSSRLQYFRQLWQLLHQPVVRLPDSAESDSQTLLDAVLEFAPHRLSLSMVIDEDNEASLVITAYWPTGTLHVEHFYHFPTGDLEDTVVNFYAEQAAADMFPIRQWGWYSPVQEFGARLQKQLRSGHWPLKRGW